MKMFTKPEVAPHLNAGLLSEIGKTASQETRDAIRTNIEKVAQDISAPEKSSTVDPHTKKPVQKQLSREDASVKRTANWLSSSRGGNEF